ncbi:hypothetical protein HYPSUDRAFT_398180 [Hypholoma sublateritium FD-334 SS-4]|uniref:Uncharacterized protein n=1 Tax=Hypholoma sublateritium (strain FD-334 SS-4) TaxID=945553 RepID=A0A0D2N7R9_HYPSF|nr:hypothetical protein HYPSUDRAFT_398180 [Hypholoma sublateritium FD-334 SS-4]
MRRTPIEMCHRLRRSRAMRRCRMLQIARRSTLACVCCRSCAALRTAASLPTSNSPCACDCTRNMRSRLNANRRRRPEVSDSSLRVQGRRCASQHLVRSSEYQQGRRHRTRLVPALSNRTFPYFLFIECRRTAARRTHLARHRRIASHAHCASGTLSRAAALMYRRACFSLCTT